MPILITVKPIRLRGETLQPGEFLRVADDNILIDKGYARRLTPEEVGEILDGYAAYAKEVFATQSEIHEPITKTDSITAQSGSLSSMLPRVQERASEPSRVEVREEILKRRSLRKE